MFKALKLMAIAAVPAVALALGGCASSGPEFVNFKELPNRPQADSVPDDTTFVARSVAPGGFTFEVPKGYRYYLVDIESDKLLYTEVAKSAGKLEVGNDGAVFRGDTIWEGDTQGASELGLFMASRPEQTDGLD